MALDPEELKKQRQLRSAQRAARQRKLLLRLGIAAVVLVLCAVLIFILLPKDKVPDQAQADSTPATQTPAQTQATQETDAAFTVIHLAMAGDVNITDKIIQAGGSSYDYTSTFMDVAHILAEADIATVNFEGSLCGEPYGGSSASAPQEMMEALSRAGVDLVQLANSYSINFYNGVSGLAKTIDGVRAAGMEPVGVYKDEADYKSGKGYVMQEVQGIKIAFVAFTKGMIEGTALPVGSENCVNVLYNDYTSTYQSVNTEKITAVLNAAKREDPDLIVAMLHWGSEYNDTISPSQESIISLLQENGVDAIVGTHPHYVQEMVFDEDEGTFVAYSLGDFLSDGEKAGSQYSVILDLEITKNNRSGNVEITGFSYTPIYSYTETWSNSLRVLRIHEAMAAFEDTFIGCVTEEVYADMIYSLTRIESRISGQG